MLTIQNAETAGAKPPRFEPLDEVVVLGAEQGTCIVRDGRGALYVRAEAANPFRFTASGALGTQVVELLDADGRPQETVPFHLDCSTQIRDEGGRFGQLLDIVYWTMVGWHGETSSFRTGGKVYKYFVGWLRDHVHTLKGMKYFYGDLKSAIDLYADTQREDGMVFDKVDKDYSERPTYRDHWFSPGGFIRKVSGGKRRMERIPVENDVEYLFFEGLYYTWKATGDTNWMAGLLDNAIRAFEYSTSDEYRWSEKRGLLKRGFTIDTWDFQSEADTAITGHTMVVDPQKSHFGIMHGDNTGFIAGCRYLAEMLKAAGRGDEADAYVELADKLKARLDELAWTGTHYLHHVPEDPDFDRGLTVDTSAQVSLSNAYALNRGIDHEQCLAIIDTYRRIRAEMPETSPGEFYQIYPPFEHFRSRDTKWEYMNGGVTTIVAGELAHGAFEHGFEDYGVDILERVHGWARAHDDYLHCCLRGAMPAEPERSFQTLDLCGQANADLSGAEDVNRPADVPGWTGEGDNDLRNLPTGRQSFHGVPFDVIDPAENGRRAVVGMSTRSGGYLRTCAVPVGRKAASVYFLHTAAGGDPTGRFDVHYADGTVECQYVLKGRNIGGWWMPHDVGSGHGNKDVCKVGWWGANSEFENVGCYVYGYDNPHPEKEIEKLVLHAAENNAFWAVLGLTLCDAPVFFMPSDFSYGIPDNWGAAAVGYALIEGLAGVKDAGVAFDRALVAPRWTAAGVQSARVTVRYRASEGYMRYDYSLEDGVARFCLAGSGDGAAFQFLLPEGRRAAEVHVDGTPVEFSTLVVENSRYVAVALEGSASHTVEIALQ